MGDLAPAGCLEPVDARHTDHGAEQRSRPHVPARSATRRRGRHRGSPGRGRPPTPGSRWPPRSTPCGGSVGRARSRVEPCARGKGARRRRSPLEGSSRRARARPSARVVDRPSRSSRQDLRRERRSFIGDRANTVSDVESDTCADVPTRSRTSRRSRDACGSRAVLETSPFPILLVSLVGDRPPLGVRAVARRRRHVADADGRPRGRGARASVDRDDHAPRPGRDMDGPAVARAGRLLRRPRARRDARGRRCSTSCSCSSRSPSRQRRRGRAARRRARPS